MKRVGGKKLKTGSVTTVPGKRVQSKKGVTTIDQPADANIIDAIQAKIETIKENIRNAPLPSAQESNSNKKCPFCEDNLFT